MNGSHRAPLPEDWHPWFANAVLTWYDQHQRSFPWRANDQPPYNTPYAIWISEMMLQQTGTKTVIPYYHRFLQTFPTPQHLAQATIEDVLQVWQGLGYYRRAHYIHQAAQKIHQHGMPQSYEQWLQLPGVGSYTAAALTAILLQQPSVAIDGNIRRVIRRFLGVKGACSVAQMQAYGQYLLPTKRWGDYTQAMMDLGSTICRVRDPQCQLCPVRKGCVAYEDNSVMDCLPPATSLSPQPRWAYIFVIQRASDHAVWMHPEDTDRLWKGLWRFVGTNWTEVPSHRLPQSMRWTGHGPIKHTLSHYQCTALVWSVILDDFEQRTWSKRLRQRHPQGQWVLWDQSPPHSRLMDKIWTKVMSSRS